MLQRELKQGNAQRGAALLIIALVLISIVLGSFLTRLGSTTQPSRQISSDALTQAKEALIGFAASYRDTHMDELFGYLPCPDSDNDGESDSCGATDVSLIGRLPWKTLGLAPLRDSAAECLWYAVSGRAKDSPKTASFNWDTLGQFIVQDAGGTILAGTDAHDRPFAVILAPQTVLGGKSRAPAGVSECGGGNTATDYLEGVGAFGTGDTTLVLANADSIANGSNNDQGLWITGKEIFARIKKRSDFKADIDTLMNDLSTCLNAVAPASLPAASTGSKGIDNVFSHVTTALNDCVPYAEPLSLRRKILDNWKDNLLYTKPGSASTVNGESDCNAVLFFAGERTTRTVAPLNPQTRSSDAEKGKGPLTPVFGDPAMYLEGGNASLFPSAGTYDAAAFFSAASTSSDLVRCIKGLSSGTTQKSFASDFASFTKAGPGSGAAVTTNTSDPANKTVTIADASGTGNGCFWLPSSIPLAGKTLRAYYDFQLSHADPSGSPDRGYGFTFQMVSGDLGAPNVCGTEANMGVVRPADGWLTSFIVETDVERGSGIGDPVGNHTAIMLNGSTNHTLSGTFPVTSACNGASSACLHAPADKFEESPTPLSHKQRIEIHTGCNAACGVCNRANHVAPNTNAKISVWIDCVDCSNVVNDFFSSELIAASENRDFSALGNWIGSNWTVASGALAHIAANSPVTLPNSALHSPPIAAASYNVTATVTSGSAGTLLVSFGGASGGITLLAGTSTVDLQLKATSAAPLTITPDAAWAGSIDNVSIVPWNTPTIQRCVALDPTMNSVFLGFTGGFRALPGDEQGVTISNFSVRSD